MEAKQSDLPSLQRRRLIIILTIFIGIVAFSPLAGCGSTGSAKKISTIVKPGTITNTVAPTPNSPWQLVWNDEFDGPAGALPDPYKWKPDIGGKGWGNQQIEYDTNNQNTYQDGQGNLVIEARNTNPQGLQCWYGTCQYTSARITTAGLFDFTYGRIEARIKIPTGVGIWPTFWLLGSNVDQIGWPASGEMDIMENIGNQPNTVYGVVHGPNTDYYGTSQTQHSIFADDFHTYACEWSATQISFFVDGHRYETVRKSTFPNQQDWVYDHPFYIILNLAVGGSWPGSPDTATVFPAKMYVSYVRVYKPA